jgi:uncharacterized membrane protein
LILKKILLVLLAVMFVVTLWVDKSGKIFTLCGIAVVFMILLSSIARDNKAGRAETKKISGE